MVASAIPSSDSVSISDAQARDGPVGSRTPTAGSAGDRRIPPRRRSSGGGGALVLGAEPREALALLSHLQCGHHEGSPGGFRPVPLASS